MASTGKHHHSVVKAVAAKSSTRLCGSAEKTPKVCRYSTTKWSKNEDSIAKAAVIADTAFEEAGDAHPQWNSITANLPRRSGKQCRKHWHPCLRPSAKKGNWTAWEDDLIQTLQKELGNEWATIANALNSIADTAFEEAGDAHLQWNSITANLPRRSGKQCREHWHPCLRPSVKKGDWTVWEDDLIQTLQKELGNKWATIANALNIGRTDNAVKNRWHSLKRSSLIKKGKAKLEIITHKTPTKIVPIARKKCPSSVLSLSIDDLKNDSVMKRSLFSPFENTKHRETSCYGLDNGENSLCIPMPPIHYQYSHEAIYACDVFSPSYGPTQLGTMAISGGVATSATIPAPSTPTIALSSIALCHSGPFMDIPLFKEHMRECANDVAARSGRKLFTADDDYGVHVSMTPLPYRRKFNERDIVLNQASPLVCAV